MKHENDILFMRAAFRLEPERCHAALMEAARSVRETPEPSKAPVRAAWIVALVLVAAVAAALATSGFGLLDWFGSYHHIELPKAAQEQLAATEQKTLVAGPVVFTVKEILSDGRVSYLAAEAKTADGSPALLYMGNGDPSDSIGRELAAALDTEGMTARTSFTDAARLAGLPLYSVEAFLNPIGGIMVEQEMMDCVYQGDGSVLLIDMVYTDPGAVGETLLADVILRAAEIDLDTMERKGDGWSAADARTVPVCGVTAKRTYAVAPGESLSVKFLVTKVTAEQTCAGVYVTVYATINGGISVLGLGRCFEVLDAQGNPYPRGISLTEECLDGDGNRLPTDPQARIYSMQYRLMITADTLPDSLILTNGSNQVLLEVVPAD